MADHIEKRKMPSLGPHGVGDPDDRTLRKTEKNVLIPQLRRKIVREEKCSKDIEEYEQCVLHTGLVKSPFVCKELKLKLGDCLEFWNNDYALNQRAREEYLEERTRYRRSGLPKETRQAIDEYLQEKKQHNESVA